MLEQLFRKKGLTENKNTQLKRCLSAFDLTLLGVGCIIGTGIFVLTGIVAATHSGPAIIISFIIAGTACAFAALSYAELSSSIGGCGSAYGYSYVAFGELFAWIIGWILLLEYGVAIAAVASGWSGYFNNALVAINIGLPEYLINPPSAGGIINLPASIIIFLIMMLLIAGVKESVKLNTIMVFIKISAILVFIFIALFNVNPSNWTPFIPFGWFDRLPDGETIGIFAGASIVFFAYVGFDAVSTAAEEAINPQKDLPKGILYSLMICTVFYIIVSSLLTGVIYYEELNVSDPVAFALSQLGYSWSSALVATGAIFGLATVMLVLFYALTRVIFSMSRDGLLPEYLSGVNKKTKTPVKVILTTGIIISTIAGFVSLGELAEIVNIGTLSAFIIVCFGVIALRSRHKENTFKNRWHPLIPLLGILCCGSLMCFLPTDTWIRFLTWLIFGIIFYFCYSIRHSKLNSFK
ncbi:amino acid permease [Nitrosomonadales bacterium]|nr:amino acid permease [Nitrosomonadales bacterium]